MPKLQGYRGKEGFPPFPTIHAGQTSRVLPIGWLATEEPERSIACLNGSPLTTNTNSSL